MRRSILSSGLAVGLVRLAGAGLGLGVTMLLGRHLGPDGLGAYGYALIVLSLLAVPVSNGWSTVLLRQLSGALHTQHWADAKGLMLRGAQLAAALSLGLALLAVLLQALLGTLLPVQIDPWLCVPLALVLFFDQLSALRQSTLRGLGLPVWGQLPEMLLRPALIIGLFWLASRALGDAPALRHAFWALAAASCVAALVGGGVLRAKAPTGLQQVLPVFHSRVWLKAAGVLSGNSFLLILNASVDVLLLGALGSLQQVGVYRVATQVALFSGFAYTALNMLATQKFAFFKAKGDTAAMRATAVFMARLALLGAVPLPVIFWAFGEPLLERLFGAAFVPALGPMALLFVGQIVNAAVGMASALLIMSGKESRVLHFTLLAVALNAALSWLLIPLWGAMGAATANLCATSAWNIGIWIYLRSSLGTDTSVLGWHSKKPFTN